MLSIPIKRGIRLLVVVVVIPLLAPLIGIIVHPLQ
jgi:hypothetical protein